MKVYLLLLLLLSMLADFTFPARRGAASSPLDVAAVDQFITAQLAAQRVPGLALAIVRGDEVLYLKGYGTAADGQPVTPQTQFFIASLSKSFTALAVMQLVEAGAIDLDAPVQRYLADFTLADPQHAARLTIRQLLHQTSGLADAGFPEALLPQPTSSAERIASLRSARPVAPPGAEFHYFNPNYAVLARVVEVVGGQRFADYLQARVFAPLQMRNSFAALTSAEAVRRAGSLAQGHLVVFGVPVAAPELEGYLGGSGGVISTAEDMAHYLIAHMAGGRFQGATVASPATIATMHTPPQEPESDYAMGWFVRDDGGTRVIEHNGVLSTFYAEAVLLPERGYGFVLLANANGAASAFVGFPTIKRGLMALLSGDPPPPGSVSVGQIGLTMGLIILIGAGLGLRRLLRLPRWAERARAKPWWWLLPGIAWPFVPGAVLLALPALLVPLADRAFGYAQIIRSMTDVVIWLGLTGVLGAATGVARLALLLRRRRGAGG